MSPFAPVTPGTLCPGCRPRGPVCAPLQAGPLGVLPRIPMEGGRGMAICEIGKKNSVVNTDFFFLRRGNLSFHILLIVIQIGLIFIEDNF